MCKVFAACAQSYMQRNFVLVTKKDETLSPSAQKFFDYITSEEAAEVIKNAGAVPVK